MSYMSRNVLVNKNFFAASETPVKMRNAAGEDKIRPRCWKVWTVKEFLADLNAPSYVEVQLQRNSRTTEEYHCIICQEKRMPNGRKFLKIVESKLEHGLCSFRPGCSTTDYLLESNSLRNLRNITKSIYMLCWSRIGIIASVQFFVIYMSWIDKRSQTKWVWHDWKLQDQSSKRELSKKAKFSVFKTLLFPLILTYGHGAWVTT